VVLTPRTYRRRLGHSDVATTLRTYTHAISSAEHDEDMRRRMAASATMG
jgi:integrase